MEWAEQQLPTFTRASQNVAAAAMILDMFPAPSTNEVGEMYQWLRCTNGVDTLTAPSILRASDTKEVLPQIKLRVDPLVCLTQSHEGRNMQDPEGVKW
jgi:hypothetical protein